MKKALLPLFLIIFLLSSDAQFPYIIFGHVLYNGNPVKNAVVNITDERTGISYITHTNENGEYSFTFGPSDWEKGDVITIKATKDGLHGIQSAILGEGAKKEINIVMKRITENHPPLIEIKYPENGSTVSGNIVISGTATDADGDEVIVEIRFDENEWRNIGNATNWEYEWNSTLVKNGLHKIYARAYDGREYSTTFVEINVENEIENEIQRNSRDNLVFFILLIAGIAVFILIWKKI